MSQGYSEGWAPDPAGVAERAAVADALAGTVLTHVRYVTIDYEASDPARPTWDFGSIHSLDFGLELEVADGERYSVSWDPPGEHEGLFLGAGPMLVRRVRADGDVAVWDAGARRPWRDAIGRPITSVDLDYRPATDHLGGYSCRRISLVVGRTRVDIVLGDATEPDRLSPSADNVAVLVTPDMPAA